MLSHADDRIGEVLETLDRLKLAAADPYEKKERPEVVRDLLGTLKAWQATLPVKPSGGVSSKERAK